MTYDSDVERVVVACHETARTVRRQQRPHALVDQA